MLFRVRCTLFAPYRGPKSGIGAKPTMPTRKLTDVVLRSLRPSERQIDYWDVRPTGFGVRLSPAGRRTFIVRYRTGGRYRRMSLGVYPMLSLAEARRHAYRVLGEVASDRDPAQARDDARSAPTFDELATLYMEKHARVKKRSWRVDGRLIAKELLPQWRTRRASEIHRRDVRALVEGIADRPAPIMANRVLALISKIFNFGIGREIVEFNPCARLDRPAKEHPRDRVLTDAEIRTLWAALDREPSDVAAAFRLRLVTAQRGVEVHDMGWRDIDLDGRWWTIPGSLTKNGLPHRVPLNALALEILAERGNGMGAGESTSPYVLPEARSARRRSTATARFALDDFRGHDLRRTAASRMASAGVPRLVIGKILNHVERGVTAVYDRHGYDAEKREALDAWACDLKAILAPTQDATTAVPVHRQA